MVVRGAVPPARWPRGARAAGGVKVMCSPALVHDYEVRGGALGDAVWIGLALLLVALGGTQRLFL